MTEVAGQGAPATPGVTVGELLNRWLEFVTPMREPGTIRGYAIHITRTKATLGHLKLSRLTAQHLDGAYWR